mgnify:CR=1 FL=1
MKNPYKFKAQRPVEVRLLREEIQETVVTINVPTLIYGKEGCDCHRCNEYQNYIDAEVLKVRDSAVWNSCLSKSKNKIYNYDDYDWGITDPFSISNSEEES